jgi:hypothetical protein
VIRVGEFNDRQSEEMLAKFLIERRNAIVRRYLPAVNPIVDLQLSPSGVLTFTNAAVDADVSSRPAEYVVNWSRFDNANGARTELGITTASEPSVAAPVDLPAALGTYVRLDISAAGGPESWADPAHAYFRRVPEGWLLVGFERMPAGNPPARKATPPRT